MAKLIDADGSLVAETTDYADLEVNEKTREEEAVAEAPEESPETPEEDNDLPAKYRGKSSAEIAQMHRELEKRLGQQSQEVGELRRAFDDMIRDNIKGKKTETAPEAEAEFDEVEFFANPQAAVQRAIDNHPTLKAAQAQAQNAAKAQSLAKLKAAHPDMEKIVGSPDFQNWVSQHDYRKKMFIEADQNYDFAAADELLSSYKERAGVVKQAQAVEKVAKKQAVKEASTGSSRGSNAPRKSGKIYRRADIIELMKTNPARYEALSPEIMKAYAEGRVK